MTPLSSFRSRIAPRVLTALDFTIDLAVLDVCIDFCERTLVVQSTIDGIQTISGEPLYYLDPSPDTKVAKVMRAWAGSTELVPLARDDVGPVGFTATITEAPGMPRGFFSDEPNAITMTPTPDAVYAVTVRVATKPSRAATQVDDLLMEDWCDGIVDGALARLHGMPHQQFTDPKLQATHYALYQQAINRASLVADRGRNRAQQRVRPVWL